MVRTFIGFALVGAQMFVAPVFAQKSRDSSGVKPVPVKSARSSKPLTASGILLIEVDYRTGRVISVRMLKSTGYPVLDKTAVDGLRKAKFEPKTKSPVKMPISFTITGAEY